MEHKLTFATGLPTKLDVQALLDKFGVPAVGTLILYSGIEEIIKVARNSGRFGSVVGSWRKLLYREHNLILESEPNKGYRVADATARVHLSTAKYKHGLRRIYRAGDIASKTATGTLTPEHKRVCAHLVNSTAALRLAAATQAKALKAS